MPPPEDTLSNPTLRFRRAIAYAMFFVLGIFAVGMEGAGLIFGVDAMVAWGMWGFFLGPYLLAIGSIFSIKTNDRLLYLLVGGAATTALLVALRDHDSIERLLHVWLVVYGVLCVTAPIVARQRKWWRVRLSIWVLCLAIFFGLFSTWDRYLHEFRPWHSTTAADLQLLAAAEGGDLAEAKAALKAGANFKVRDKEGRDALWLASVEGHLPIVELLLERGANPNTRRSDLSRATALELVAIRGHTDVFKAMLQAGADLYLKDGWGQTPLTYAARAGRVRVIEMLIDAGADPNALDGTGRNALQTARDFHQTEAAAFLENAVAQAGQEDASLENSRRKGSEGH